MDTHDTAQPTHQTQTHEPHDMRVIAPAAVHINVAAQLAGVSRRTIYSWIAQGKVEVRFLPSGAQLVVVSSLILAERPTGVGSPQPTRNSRKVA